MTFCFEWIGYFGSKNLAYIFFVSCGIYLLEYRFVCCIQNNDNAAGKNMKAFVNHHIFLSILNSMLFMINYNNLWSYGHTWRVSFFLTVQTCCKKTHPIHPRLEEIIIFLQNTVLHCVYFESVHNVIQPACNYIFNVRMAYNTTTGIKKSFE